MFFSIPAPGQQKTFCPSTILELPAWVHVLRPARVARSHLKAAMGDQLVSNLSRSALSSVYLSTLRYLLAVRCGHGLSSSAQFFIRKSMQPRPDSTRSTTKDTRISLTLLILRVQAGIEVSIARQPLAAALVCEPFKEALPPQLLRLRRPQRDPLRVAPRRQAVRKRPAQIQSTSRSVMRTAKMLAGLVICV